MSDVVDRSNATSGAASTDQLEVIGTELDPDIRVIADEPGWRGVLHGFRRRLAQGELGNMPVLLGLAVIWTVFQILNDRFLSAVNLTNLVLQIAAMGTISVGIVLVLLLGEIDLSVGSVSGLAAAVMAVLNVKNGWPAVPAIAAGVAVGVGIGVFQGLWITKLRVPSFVVTLAGLLAWQGALLYVLGTTGTINITNSTIVGLTGTFFGRTTSWVIAIGVIALYAGSLLLNAQRRRGAGLTPPPMRALVGRIVPE